MKVLARQNRQLRHLNVRLGDVPFRAEAAAVISEHPTSATGDRLTILVVIGVVGGPLALALLAARTARRTWSPSAVAAVVLLAWAVVSIIAGGSYWLHYLVQLTPGLSLAVAAAIAADRVGARMAQALSGYVLAGALGFAAVAGSVGATSPPTDREAVGRWLDGATRPGDTAVVAWGQPSILYEAGVHSPTSSSGACRSGSATRSSPNSSGHSGGPARPTGWSPAADRSTRGGSTPRARTTCSRHATTSSPTSTATASTSSRARTVPSPRPERQLPDALVTPLPVPVGARTVTAGPGPGRALTVGR